MTAVVLQFPTPLKPRDEAFYAATEAYNYFDGAVKMMEASLHSNDRGIIAGMHNIFGGFKPEIKHKFLSFINQPSFESWLAIRDHLIDLSTTSWQLWLKYDHNAPMTYSTKETNGMYPNPDDFIQYYTQHRFARIDMLRNKRDEALAIINTYQ